LCGLLDQLVNAAQEEIVDQEWGRVIEATLQQERSWNQFRPEAAAPIPGTAAGSRALKWRSGKSSLDRTLVAVAAEAIARGVRPDFESVDIAGQPFLEEIPTPVLAELGSRALMRAGSSALGAIPNETLRAAVGGSAPWKLVFKWGAPILRHWARFVRSAPDWRVAGNAGLVATCVVLMAVGLVMAFHVPLPFAGRPLYALLIGVPSLVLVVWAWFFRR
jgi:hypothetical protein